MILIILCNQVIKTIDPVVRPKGLGLGAAKPKDKKVNKNVLMNFINYIVLSCYGLMAFHMNNP